MTAEREQRFHCPNHPCIWPACNCPLDALGCSAERLERHYNDRREPEQA